MLCNIWMINDSKQFFCQGKWKVHEEKNSSASKEISVPKSTKFNSMMVSIFSDIYHIVKYDEILPILLEIRIQISKSSSDKESINISSVNFFW